MDLIGVVDTMFARYDMGAEALDELAQCPGYGTRFTTVRRTVPGFKDLAVAAKKLIEEEDCRIVVALGMPGREQVDKVCAHEASTGIMTAQLMTNTPILEVFVHEDESDDPADLALVFKNRSRDHARNAYLMLYEPERWWPERARASARASPTPARSSRLDPALRRRAGGPRPGSGIAWEAEHLLGHDVALHLRRTSADGERGEKRKPRDQVASPRTAGGGGGAVDPSRRPGPSR